MRKMNEDKILITKTTYGYDETEAHKLFTVKGTKVEIWYNGILLYERYMEDYLSWKQSTKCNPIDCFLDYIILLDEQPESCRQAGNNASKGFYFTWHRWFKTFYFKKQFFKVFLNKFFLSGKSTVK